MKRKYIMIFTVLFLVMGITGCGADKTVYYEQADSGEAIPNASSETESQAENDVNVQSLQDDAYSGKAEAEKGSTDSAQADDLGEKAASSQDEVFYVYVCGAVRAPGVYMLHSGDRIYEAIVMAGGLNGNASTVSVNQAETISDGQMIFVPTIEEANAGITMPQVSGIQGSAEENSDATEDGKVNLNTASLEELMTLPGIGETRANDILAYRMEHGAFAAVEEIMNVNGIKEGLYNRIKDNIKVN